MATRFLRMVLYLALIASLSIAFGACTSSSGGGGGGSDTGDDTGSGSGDDGSGSGSGSGDDTGSTGDDDGGDDGATTVTETVGSEGGTFSEDFAGGVSVEVTIPAGALTGDTQITISLADLTNAQEDGVLGVGLNFSPSGLVLLQPITVVLSYTNDVLDGADEENVRVNLWDEDAEAWVRLSGTVNASANTVTVTLNHFSLYALREFTPNPGFLTMDADGVLYSLAMSDTPNLTALFDTGLEYSGALATAATAANDAVLLAGNRGSAGSNNCSDELGAANSSGCVYTIDLQTGCAVALGSDDTVNGIRDLTYIPSSNKFYTWADHTSNDRLFSITKGGTFAEVANPSSSQSASFVDEVTDPGTEGGIVFDGTTLQLAFSNELHTVNSGTGEKQFSETVTESGAFPHFTPWHIGTMVRDPSDGTIYGLKYGAANGTTYYIYTSLVTVNTSTAVATFLAELGSYNNSFMTGYRGLVYVPDLPMAPSKPALCGLRADPDGTSDQLVLSRNLMSVPDVTYTVYWSSDPNFAGVEDAEGSFVMAERYANECMAGASPEGSTLYFRLHAADETDLDVISDPVAFTFPSSGGTCDPD